MIFNRIVLYVVKFISAMTIKIYIKNMFYKKFNFLNKVAYERTSLHFQFIFSREVISSQLYH